MVEDYGKGNEVENFMKRTLDVRLVTCERGLKTATEADRELSWQHIQKLAARSNWDYDASSVTFQTVDTIAVDN